MSFKSDALGRNVALRITTRAVRTVQKVGGIDAFLIGSDETKLPETAARLNAPSTAPSPASSAFYRR